MTGSSEPLSAVDAARGTLDVTASLFPYPSPDLAVSPALLAMSGVARCRRLLQGMVDLHFTRPDLAGVLARTHFETWVWTMFLLLDGEEARRRLEANDAYEVRRRAQDFIEVFGPGGSNADSFLAAARQQLDEIHPARTQPRLSLIDAAKKVTDLLAIREERVPDYPRRMYAIVYRAESLLSVHWGLAVADTHLKWSDSGHPIVVDRPADRGVEERRLELTASGLLSVAGEAARQLGLDDSPVMAFGRNWFQSTDFPAQPRGGS